MDFENDAAANEQQPSGSVSATGAMRFQLEKPIPSPELLEYYPSDEEIIDRLPQQFERCDLRTGPGRFILIYQPGYRRFKSLAEVRAESVRNGIRKGKIHIAETRLRLTMAQLRLT